MKKTEYKKKIEAEIYNLDFFSNVKVSVFCLTYNHRDYIKDAIEGFLAQKTSFEVQIIVFDDASNDGTSDILKEYAERFPQITLVVSKENLFSNDKIFITFEVIYEISRGEYIAVCEGDDYWIDPLKLQKQVDIFEADRSVALVGHASKWVDCMTGEEKEFHPYNSTRQIEPREIIIQRNGNISTASLMTKKENFLFPEDFPKSPVGDYRLQLRQILIGKVFYIDEIMSCYRYNHNGSWTRENALNRKKLMAHDLKMCSFLYEYNNYSLKKYENELYKKFVSYLNDAYVNKKQLQQSEFIEFWNDYQSDNKEAYEQYWDMLKNREAMLKGTYRIEEEIRNNICSAKNIIIYGNGNYSDIVKVVLENNSIDWTGSVVTELSEEERNNSARWKLWQVTELPYKVKECFFVVAVSDKYKEEIETVLRCMNAKYWAPFWEEYDLFA